MHKLLLTLASATFLSGAAHAADIYPLDRATILVGSPFDFKVELDKVVKPEEVKVTVNGQDYEALFGSKAEFVAEEKGSEDKVLAQPHPARFEARRAGRLQGRSFGRR